MTASPGRLLIDEESYVPLPEQIRRGILDQIRAAILPAGSRLPTVRQLARDLDLAPGTVAKGYQLLETEGAVETRGRRGTFVAANPPAEAAAPPAARDAAERYLREAATIGLTHQEAVAVLTRLMAERETG